MQPTTPDDEAEILLVACLKQPPPERAAALDRLCESYPDVAESLRRRFALLDGVGFLDDLSDGDVAGTEAGDDAAGRPFGRYQLLDRIGVGAMGVVWRARDLQLGRKVAVKTIRPELLDRELARRRFEREAAALTRLSHPNLCCVLDAGDIDGTPFFSMPLLEGTNLDALIQSLRRDEPVDAPPAIHQMGRDWRSAARLIEQIAAGLGAAHAAGVVHRDVKPANVMVTTDGTPVLFDFGLAADLLADRLTRTGDRIGTPYYMAPEQVDPARGQIDARADVYALGVLLYECLTLQLPFDAGTTESLYRQILRGDAIPLRRRRRDLPRPLALIVEKAFDPQPENRYGDARELAADLAAVQRDAPISAGSPGAATRLRRLAHRQPTLTAIVVLSTVAVIVLVAMLVELLAAKAEVESVRASQEALERVRVDPIEGAPAALAAASPSARLAVVQRLFEVARYESPRTTWGAHWISDRELAIATDQNPNVPNVLVWEPGAETLKRVGGQTGVIMPGFSQNADGLWSATADDGSTTVFTRDLEEMAHLHGPEGGHEKNRCALVLNGSPPRAVVGHTDGTLRLWDVGREEELFRLEIGEHAVSGLRDLGDGVHVAVCTGMMGRVADRTRRNWLKIVKVGEGSLETVQEISSPEIYWTLDVSPDHRRMLTAELDGTVSVYRRVGSDSSQWSPAWEERPCGGMAGAAFVDGGRRVVMVHADQTARLVDAGNGRLIRHIPVSASANTARVVARGSPADGSFVIADGTVIRQFSAAGRELRRFHGHDDHVLGVFYNPEGDRLASTGYDGSVHVWATRNDGMPCFDVERAEDPRFARAPDLVVPFALDASRQFCAAPTLAQTVNVWSRTGEHLAGPVGLDLSKAVADVTFSPDSKTVVVCWADPKIAIWRWQTDQEPDEIDLAVLDLPAQGRNPFCRARFTDNETLVVKTKAHGLYRYSLREGRFEPHAVSQSAGLGMRTPGIALDLVHQRLATCGWSGEVRIVDLADPTRSYACPMESSQRDKIYTVAFDPAGNRLAAGGNDRRLRVWDVPEGDASALSEPQFADGHESSITSVVFLEDGETLVSAGKDHTIRTWDARTLEPVGNIEIHDSFVWALLDVGGGRVMGLLEHGVVRTWCLDDRSARKLINARLERSTMTPDQAVRLSDDR